MGSLPAPSLHQRRVTDGADSDHCSDSGGTTTADVEMQDSGLEMSVNEGEAEGMLQGERIELIVGSSAVRWVEGIATSQEKQVQC